MSRAWLQNYFPPRIVRTNYCIYIFYANIVVAAKWEWVGFWCAVANTFRNMYGGELRELCNFVLWKVNKNVYGFVFVSFCLFDDMELFVTLCGFLLEKNFTYLLWDYPDNTKRIYVQFFNKFFCKYLYVLLEFYRYCIDTCKCNDLFVSEYFHFRKYSTYLYLKLCLIVKKFVFLFQWPFIAFCH